MTSRNVRFRETTRGRELIFVLRQKPVDRLGGGGRGRKPNLLFTVQPINDQRAEYRDVVYEQLDATSQTTCSLCNEARIRLIHVKCCTLPQRFVFVTIVFTCSTNKPL